MVKKAQSGFTLIELLVGITVLMFIIVLIVSSFRSYARVQLFDQSVADIRNGLNEAKAKTLGSVNGTVYGIYVGTSTVQFFSGATPVVNSANNIIISFPKGITATSSLTGHAWYLTFARITGTPTATGTITILDSISNTSKTFSVSATGLVQ
jgi:type II secretory pathway pseudopilin PulG